MMRTHCHRGHEYETSAYFRPDGERHCEPCAEIEAAAALPEPKKPNKFTHCKRGHERNFANTYYDKVSSYGQCRACRREKRAETKDRINAKHKELRANKTWYKPRREWTAEETARFDAAMTGLLISITREVERREGPLLTGAELEDSLTLNIVAQIDEERARQKRREAA